MDVVGRNGRAVASLDQGRVDVWKKDGENRIHTCIQAKGRPVVEFAGVRENFEDFVRAIRTGTEPLAGVEAGLTAVKHGLAVLQSLKTKAEERV